MKSHPALTKALRTAPKLPANVRLVNIRRHGSARILDWHILDASGKTRLVTTQATQHPVNARHFGGLS